MSSSRHFRRARRDRLPLRQHKARAALALPLLGAHQALLHRRRDDRYDDYVALGGEQGAKEAGKMRVEGKEYVVKDGDVLLFRFNV